MPSGSETISAMLTDQHVRVAHTLIRNHSFLVRSSARRQGCLLSRQYDTFIQRT
jgi:hypothetical protein